MWQRTQPLEANIFCTIEISSNVQVLTYHVNYDFKSSIKLSISYSLVSSAYFIKLRTTIKPDKRSVYPDPQYLLSIDNHDTYKTRHNNQVHCRSLFTGKSKRK